MSASCVPGATLKVSHRLFHLRHKTTLLNECQGNAILQKWDLRLTFWSLAYDHMCINSELGFQEPRTPDSPCMFHYTKFKHSHENKL